MRPSNEEVEFGHELDALYGSATAFSQFLCAYLAIHRIVSSDASIEKALNKEPVFWNTVLAALQDSIFTSLGRVFDVNSRRNLGRLIKIAESNVSIFSKEALRARYLSDSSRQQKWLDSFLARAYEPSPADFVRIRDEVDKCRTIYAPYKRIRDEVVAHAVAVVERDAARLFEKTKVDDLETLCSFLLALHEALNGLFVNGSEPILRPEKFLRTGYSAEVALKVGQESIGERVLREVQLVLRRLAPS